ncbi:sialidase family protein [Membranihabitans maritimus]|uniref:sialidase family protein n=1 Tax=Membranihabitans maritimus TaxID=2904244 RepID=UPI001F42C1D4|nr:sialidase family protein [Membranihabitans maritimus]
MKKILFISAVIYLIISGPTNTLISQENQNLFLNSPKLIKDPGLYYKYSPDSRRFTGISSLAVTKGGHIWAVWYAGTTPGEDHNNYVVVANSNDNGNSWNEVLVIDPDSGGPVRTFDPEVWVDPNGKLWVFWAQGISQKIQVEMEGHIAGVWAITTNDGDNPMPEWSSPRRLAEGVMMCKPTVLSDGEWILPVSTWFLTDNSAKLVSSTDQGKTWKVKGECHIPEDIRTFDEHMIIEKDDHSLWMWIRTKAGIGESFSTDVGKTWSDMKNSEVEHPSARFFIRKLNSGNLLLVKHGPISVRTGRSHLMAFISKDDGENWSNGLLLDERPSVSYPDGQQTPDGTIYITYDYNRTGEQKVYMTSFTEEDILSPDYDKSILKVFNNRKVISDGGK